MESRLNRFLRTRPLAAVGMTVVLGAAAGVSATEGLPLFFAGAAAFALIAILLCALKKPHRFAAWLCVILFLSAGYGAFRAIRPDMQIIRGADVTAVVADAPEWQNDRQRAVMRLTDVVVNGEAIPYDLRLYAYGEAAREITLADQLRLLGNLYVPSRSGNGAFDFRNYLWAEGVGQYMSLEAAEISVVPRDGGFMEQMAHLRGALQRRVDELFPQNAALLKGLMLGDRTDIAEEDEIAFSESGIMHLLAVSGLHVSLLASVLTLLGTALCIPRLAMTVAVTVLLICYAIICGGSPSIVRAVVMYVLLQGGTVARRTSDPLTRLSAACGAMTLINPLFLWQTGFTLSFAAVAGLTVLLPTMQQLRDKLPRPCKRGFGRRLTDLLLAGFSVQLGSLPIVVAAFGQVSWMSLLLNILCIPMAQVTLILGLISLACSFSLPVGPIAALADGLTGWLLGIAHWAAELPFGLMQIPALILPVTVLYVACIALSSAQLKTKLRTRLIAICLLPALVVGNAAMLRYQVAQEDFSVTFLDVGQADAAIINADGRLYLVDVGETDAAAQYISDRQLDIEGIFISHAHDDHAGGLGEVLAVCDPAWICLPESYYGGEADIAALTVIAQAEAEGAQIRTLAAGDEVRLSDEISAEALYPPKGVMLDGGNESSLLMRVTYGDGSVLFTGDLPADAEPLQLPKCSVLKVAHHGANSSTSARFLANVQPKLAIISVGEGNSYGHPGEETLGRLVKISATVLRTDVHGAITVDIDRDGNVWANTYFPMDD